ncbi:MAG: hypothetical protein K2N35_01275 [Muribaculaceae bacterium]|nr:hypothetical protein [Muribaculaceae bacterium]
MKKFLLFAAACVAANASVSAAETENVVATMYPGNASFIAWGCDNLLTQDFEIDGRIAAKFDQTAVDKNPWEVQFAYDLPGGYEVGTTYYIKFDVKGDPSDGIGSCFQCTDGWAGCGDLNAFPITSEWTTVTISGKVSDPGEGKSVDRWVASIGTYLGTFYISNVSMYTLGEGGETPVDPTAGWTSIIQGGKASEGVTESLLAGWNGAAQLTDNPNGDGKVFVCPIAADPVNAWDSQFFIVFDEALQEGDVYQVSFDYYCSDARTIDLQAQGNPGEYHHWYCGIPSLKAKPEWQVASSGEYTVDAEMAKNGGFKTIALNLASAPEAANFYINNVVVEKAVTTGVSTVNAVVVPVSAVYNLQGVKVANSIDEVATPGLYISNGKKIIKK